MRPHRILTTVLLSFMAVAGCTSESEQSQSQGQGQSKAQLPADQATLDGRPYTYKTGTTLELYYDTYDGYENGKYRPQADSLDAVMASAEPTVPVVTNFDSLGPSIRALPDVTQRAIAVTRQRAHAGQALNLLPSKLAFMPKPEGSQAMSNKIDEQYGNVDDYTFAAAYIEQKGAARQLVLVTASNSYDTESSFRLNRGVTQFSELFKTTLPGENAVTALLWNAVPVQPDCSNVRKYRGVYSSSCGFILQGDQQKLDGHANVILVAPVHILETRGYFQNEGAPVHSYADAAFQILFNGSKKKIAEALSPSGWPYSAAPLTPPVSSTFASLIAGGAKVVGSNDILSWPAYTVPGQ